jgi:hypothetical protein
MTYLHTGSHLQVHKHVHIHSFIHTFLYTRINKIFHSQKHSRIHALPVLHPSSQPLTRSNKRTYIYIYIYIYSYLPTHLPTHLPTYLPTHIHTCIYIHGISLWNLFSVDVWQILGPTYFVYCLGDNEKNQSLFLVLSNTFWDFRPPTFLVIVFTGWENTQSSIFCFHHPKHQTSSSSFHVNFRNINE